jgi:hypothetical protein
MKCMISLMNLLKSLLDCISLCRQTKQLDGIHGYNHPKTRKGELNKMFMCAYLGMSALVAGYFVVMYKIFY